MVDLSALGSGCVAAQNVAVNHTSLERGDAGPGLSIAELFLGEIARLRAQSQFKCGPPRMSAF